MLLLDKEVKNIPLFMHVPTLLKDKNEEHFKVFWGVQKLLAFSSSWHLSKISVRLLSLAQTEKAILLMKRQY